MMPARSLHHLAATAGFLTVWLPVLSQEEPSRDPLPLPEWRPEELQSMRDGSMGASPTLSLMLLPGVINPSSPGGELPGDSGPQAPTDTSLFVPSSLLAKLINRDNRSSPTPAADLREVSRQYLASCQQSPEDEHLIDPDGLVPETQREDLLRLLEFHSRDARIKAYLTVMNGDQKLPEAAPLAAFASGALTGNDSCLAVFPLGEPWRARLFLSKSVHKSATPADLASLASDCANDAMQVSDPLEQLHRFAVRLSIRLFWLEKKMPPDPQAIANRAILASQNHPLQAITLTDQHTMAAAVIEDHGPSLFARIISAFGFSLVVIIGLIAGTVAYLMASRHRHRLRTHVWTLPECDPIPRLGGAFCGGGGAWVQFR